MMSESSTSTWSGVERRINNDRRGREVFSLHGQRAHARRAEDAVNYYVDRYSARWFVLMLSIIFLCCADAIFTLQLISTGIATEANPLMRIAMDHGVVFFIWAKLGLTTAGLLLLLKHKNFHIFQRIKVKYLICAVLVMYAALIKYELWLFNLPSLI